MQALKLSLKNIVSHGLSASIGLFYSIAAARFLTAKDFGELRLVMTLLPIFMSFSFPGYDSIILRNLSLRIEVSLLRIFYSRMILGGLGTALILCSVYVMGERLSPVLRFFLFFIALLLPFFETATGYKNYLVGKRRKDTALNLYILTRGSTLILMASIVYIIHRYNLPHIYIFPTYMISMTIPTLLTFLSISLKKSSKKIKQGPCFLGAVSVTYAGLIYTLAFSIDKLLVWYTLGPTQLAEYSILVMAPQELSRFFDSVVLIYYHELFFSKKETNIWKHKRIGIFLMLLVAFYVLFFYKFHSSIFGKNYQFAFYPVLLSGMMILSLSFELFQNQRIFALYGSNSLFQYSLTSLCATIILVPSFLLGGLYGLMTGLIVKQFITPSLFLLFLKTVRK